MEKPYKIILILIMLANVIIGVLLFQQSSQLTEYEQVITNLKVNIEDLNDVIEGQVVPDLREIKNIDNWEVRYEFVRDGEEILRVMPDPVLEAGTHSGYIFHFSEPFETFKDKEIAIYAYHKNTGEKFTVASPELIKEPSPGYYTLERFTATTVIPISGLWRYEVEINGEFYADIVLNVK